MRELDLKKLDYRGREIKGTQCPSCYSKKIVKSFIEFPWPYVCLGCKNLFFIKNTKNETKI